MAARRGNPTRIDALTIAIVSSNPETLDGTEQYLRRVGAETRALHRLRDAASATQRCDVVILFADDFARTEALAIAEQLCGRTQPKQLIVVTENVETYADIEPPSSRRTKLTVLRRPAWGWMLVDAIRARLDDPDGRSGGR